MGFKFEVDEERKHINLEMACSCSTKPEEYDGKAICEAEYERAKHYMSLDGEELLGTLPPEKHFVSHVVVWMNWEANAHISYIHNDMWSGIGVQWGYDDDAWSIRCECDEIEYGLARIVVFLYEMKELCNA